MLGLVIINANIDKEINGSWISDTFDINTDKNVRGGNTRQTSTEGQFITGNRIISAIKILLIEPNLGSVP